MNVHTRQYTDTPTHIYSFIYLFVYLFIYAYTDIDAPMQFNKNYTTCSKLRDHPRKDPARRLSAEQARWTAMDRWGDGPCIDLPS